MQTASCSRARARCQGAKRILNAQDGLFVLQKRNRGQRLRDLRKLKECQGSWDANSNKTGINAPVHICRSPAEGEGGERLLIFTRLYLTAGGSASVLGVMKMV